MTGSDGAGAPGAALRVLATVLRPAVRIALRRYLRRQSRPCWDDRAIVPGPHPLRVLIVGAGLVVGYGADDGTASLPRRLAGALAHETGRGVLVETRAQASLPLEQTVQLLGMSGAATFDVVVWSPTLEEAVRGGAGRWSRHLRTIVDALRASGPSHLQVVLMGLPVIEGEHVLHRVGQVLAGRVNRRIRGAAEACGRTGFLAVPSRAVPDDDTPLFDGEYQRALAARLVDRLASLSGVGGASASSPASRVPAAARASAPL